MRRIHKLQIVILALFMVFLVSAAMAQGQGQRHRVFILHSYEKDDPCGQPQADGVIVALKEAGFDEKNTDFQFFYI